MKNRKYNFITVILVLSMIGFLSCDLTEYDPSGASAEGIWETTEVGFMTLINATYDRQRYLYGKVDGPFVTESGTDLWFNRDKRLWAAEFSQYHNFDANTGFNTSVWREFYQGVLHCNAAINRIDDVIWSSEEEKNMRLAEAKYMRAFYYWHIVETWGDVILRTEEPEDAIAHRSPIEDFYDLILSDLEFATEHLPIEWGDEYSRASQKSAWGLKARAALSRAYYGMENSYFELARDAAQTVIDRSAEFGVELWENYADIHDPENNRDNKEVLHIISNSTNTALNYDGRGNQTHQYFTTQYSGRIGLVMSLEYGRDGGRQFMPTLGFLDMFDDEMDARYHATFQEVWIANEDYTWTEQDVNRLDKDPSLVGTTITAGVDTAMLITKRSISNQSELPYKVFDRDDVYHEDGSIITGNEYVAMTKFFDPITRDSPAQQSGFLDVFVIRFAEMYLVAAEAEHQLGNDGAAADMINVLRTRAAVKEPVDYTSEMQISAGDIDLDFILDERARELGGEFLRWFDLKRTKTIEDRIARHNPDITQFNPNTHYLRPVPQTELDALENGDEFGQNPGY